MFYFLSWQISVIALALDDKAWKIANEGLEAEILIRGFIAVCHVCVSLYLFWLEHSIKNTAKTLNPVILLPRPLVCISGDLWVWLQIGEHEFVDFWERQTKEIYEGTIINTWWLSKLGRIINIHILLLFKTIIYPPLFISLRLILCCLSF